jgi:hypothetical protein
VGDATVKRGISNLVALLIGFVAHHDWSPNGDIANTFRVRPEELKMLLLVANHVNPSHSTGAPLLELPMDAAVSFDVLSNDSYYDIETRTSSRISFTR